MSRYVLRHRVQRTLREPTIDLTVHADIEDAYRVADIEAAFSTSTPWRQELAEPESGQRWVRTRDVDWALVDTPSVSR